MSSSDSSKTELSSSASTVPRKGSSVTRSPSTSTRQSGSTLADDEVRILTTAEYKAAAECLSEAFAQDHVARYFLDTPARARWSEEKKWKLHCKIMEYIVYQHLLRGLVTAVGPGYGSVALWCTPDSGDAGSTLTYLRSGIWRLLYKLDREARTRFFGEFWPLLSDTKEATLKSRESDSYYLVYIGTKASARGRGYARKNIEYITNKADKEGRACYLESSDEINVKIYRKLGFDVDRQIFLTRAEEKIQMDIMVREPVRKLDMVKEEKTGVEPLAGEHRA